MELKDLPTQLIQTVVTMAAGTGYEPWVKLMLFIILGLGVARLAMHPMIRALAHTIRVGVTRATRALERLANILWRWHIVLSQCRAT
jgi:hypothetical protein